MQYSQNAARCQYFLNSPTGRLTVNLSTGVANVEDFTWRSSLHQITEQSVCLKLPPSGPTPLASRREHLSYQFSSCNQSLVIHACFLSQWQWPWGRPSHRGCHCATASPPPRVVSFIARLCLWSPCPLCGCSALRYTGDHAYQGTLCPHIFVSPQHISQWCQDRYGEKPSCGWMYWF